MPKIKGKESIIANLRGSCTSYQQAYPLFLSANNFDLIDAMPLFLPLTHPLYKHVREETVEWCTKSRLTAKRSTRQLTADLNTRMIDDLYKYSNLHTIHIECMFWYPVDDLDYRYLERHFKEDQAICIYLKRTGLDAFLSIPRINKVTLHHYRGSKETEDLKFVGEYITKHLVDYRIG